MDILRVQDLIKDGRVTTLADIDPTKAYLQYGLFQTGNRQNNASNADAYKSYVIPISELLGGPSITIQNKNFIGVDPIYGNDAQAAADGNYNPNSAYKSIDVAVANAKVGDTLLLYPGTHITFGINNPVCSFFGFGGSIISNPFGGSVFNIIGGGFGPATLDVEGDSIISGVSGSVINTKGAIVNIKCKQIVNPGVFYAGIYVDTGSKVQITCDEIDTRGNFSNAVTVDNDSELILNANVLRYSWTGYIVGTASTLIANVAKNIQHDLVGDFTALGNSCVLIANGASNAMVKINGDLYDEKTVDPMSASGGALNFQNGASGTIILNGHRSYVKQIYALRNANCPGGEIIVNSEIINTWANLFGGASGMGAWLNAGILRLRNKLQTVNGSPADPCITYVGGTLILDNAVILANPGAESIAAPAPITYNCYSGYTNNAPNANATNAIAGTTLIIDPLVQ